VTTENLFLPDSLVAALDLLDQHGADLFVIAGGTVGMLLINEGVVSPRLVMSLHKAKLNDIRPANNHWEIGATATLSRVTQMRELPLLAEAARHIGGWAIRNMATLGGNLFVPPPAGDAAVALLALDAEVIATGSGGARTIPIGQFFQGRCQTALAANELVTSLNVPRPAGETAFLKFGRRQQNTPAVVTIAVRVLRDGQGSCTDARIALGSAGDYPLRAAQAETSLLGRKLDTAAIAQAGALAAEEARPFSDALASADYRRKMVAVFVRRALEVLGT
jgi:CO/xanthine dehydrogenase FAD-binding subunit